MKGIHFELAHTPLLPSIRSYRAWMDILESIWCEHPEWKQPPWVAMRELPSRRSQGRRRFSTHS